MHTGVDTKMNVHAIICIMHRCLYMYVHYICAQTCVGIRSLPLGPGGADAETSPFLMGGVRISWQEEPEKEE